MGASQLHILPLGLLEDALSIPLLKDRELVRGVGERALDAALVFVCPQES